MLKKVVILLISVLLIFPETSLDTSLAIQKDSPYSIYLYKLFGLSLSDWIIVLLAILIFLIVSQKKNVHVGIMKPILLVYICYFFIGIVYNMTVALDVKSFLYDVKVSLYLFIPYLSLSILSSKIDLNRKTISLVVFFVVLGSIYDALYVAYVGGYEYTSRFGMFLILETFPISLLIGAWFFLRPTKYYFKLIIFEYISSINRSNLGSIFSGTTSIAWLYILNLKIKLKSKVAIMIVSYYSIVIVLPLLVMFVFSDLVGVKKTGMEIRRGEIINFIENSTINIPIVIGKGLGTTWKEIVPAETANVYSQGHLLGYENKFIWHNTLAGSFYKFGIIGSLFLIFYLSIISARLYKVSKMNNNKVGMFIAFTIPVFVMMNVNGPGVLKGALLSSLLLYGADRLLRGSSIFSNTRPK